MANVKTAISLQKPLFEQVDALARSLQISRSRLFALAMKDFLQKQQNRKLLEEINAAYEKEPAGSEKKLQRYMLHHQSKMLEGEW